MMKHSLFQNIPTTNIIKRDRNPRFEEIMNKYHNKGSYSSTDISTNRGDSFESISIKDFDPNTFQLGYSDTLKKLSDFYNNNPDIFNLSSIFKTNTIYCEKLKEIGKPIYIDTIFKGKHFSLRVAEEISNEIDRHLLGLNIYDTSQTTNEKNKLLYIKYALCTCTKDRHKKQCNTYGIENGGKRKRNKKTMRKRKTIKKRRNTRKH